VAQTPKTTDRDAAMTTNRVPLSCAVLTVSDTRTDANDTSGDLLAELIVGAGHALTERSLCRDDIYQIRAIVSQWIAADAIQVVITTGGTGFTGRDSTPEALTPLFDKTIAGFGELFRQISWEEIGSSTIQSRAIGGLANGTLIFALPGSTNAVRTGWEKVIRSQLDIDNRPCNFAELLPRFRER
jgi:molybdenum cofactor biosynthesis protein B